MTLASRRDSARAALTEFGAGMERLADWRRRLTVEFVALPETLRTLREGAVNFELVSRRLTESSVALEQMTKLYEATLADSTRRSADAAKALRSQIDALAEAGSPDQVMSAFGEIQRMMESMAELNPFWPTSREQSE